MQGPQAMQMQVQQPFAQPGPPQVSQMQGGAHSPHHGQHGQQPQQQMHQMPQQMHQMPQQMQHPRVPPPAQMVQQQMPMGSPSLMGSSPYGYAAPPHECHFSRATAAAGLPVMRGDDRSSNSSNSQSLTGFSSAASQGSAASRVDTAAAPQLSLIHI